jgi:hypothetical protein
MNEQQKQVITLKLDSNIYNLDIDNAISLVNDLSAALDNLLGSQPEESPTNTIGVPEKFDSKSAFCNTCQEYHLMIPKEHIFCPLCGTEYTNIPTEGFTIH